MAIVETQGPSPINPVTFTTSEAVLDILNRLPPEAEAADRMLPAECYTSPAFFEFERQGVFARSWICVGRVEQLANHGDCISAQPAGEPIIVTRSNDKIHAMAAICRHRGQVIPCTGNQKTLRCPLHYWTYDLEGRLIGAPHIGREETAALRRSERLPPIRLELWHGFVFVNLDPNAEPLAPSLAKVEPFWAGYEAADLVGIPPKLADKPLPWNWKVHVENFTDAYHPEFVHRGTHDFAPSVLAEGGVVFTDMKPGDNAIVRTVPMLKPDGGMMRDGWGENPAFPPITTISAAQRQRLTFVMIPPSMTMVFAPNAIAFTLISATAVEETYASSDRQTAGGWLMPRSSVELADFRERAAMVLEGGAKIWAQDVPENMGMQKGKKSRFAPRGIYGPLETTLVQFNVWLINAYKQAAKP
ncbi:Rieske 2Fe-2S domain-containing protein [Bradyrhizobium sp. dw_78]|uniref:aromatic ring-hydroxylating oxygenase subunit alpha n=1 Tax=Bradyrhizobium sp. dw_78 TaxID=2719793 RepID=UPI001BD20A75|nr:Rieske 2Fe-2S domain-containing protein [Bradyrhizobium sp. dw_78]